MILLIILEFVIFLFEERICNFSLRCEKHLKEYFRKSNSKLIIHTLGFRVSLEAFNKDEYVRNPHKQPENFHYILA